MNLKEKWRYNYITCPENGCRCDPINDPKCNKAKPRFVDTVDSMSGSYLDFTCDCKAKWYNMGRPMLNHDYEGSIVPWAIGGIVIGSVIGILLNLYLTNGI